MTSTVVYVPHGGGPLPLLADRGHQNLKFFLENLPKQFSQVSAILVVSAHWESTEVTITSGPKPGLIYDYYGFPKEAYDIQYPAPGEPHLAHLIKEQLDGHDIRCKLDSQRGFDHGVFVPLALMYPEASIPVVQISLVQGLDPQTHIHLGNALSTINYPGLLILGSGMSFHNMRSFMTQGSDGQGKEFDQWLVETCCSEDLDVEQRQNRLINWELAPHARFVHPREEHLLPLQVCFGVAAGLKRANLAQLIFHDHLLGQQVSGFLW